MGIAARQPTTTPKHPTYRPIDGMQAGERNGIDRGSPEFRPWRGRRILAHEFPMVLRAAMRISRRDLVPASAASLAAVSSSIGVAAEATADPVTLPPRPESGLLFSCKYGMTQGPTLESRLAAAREAGLVGVKKDGPEGPDRARDEIAKAIPLAATLGQRILFENVWNGLFYEDDGPRNQSVQPWADYIDSFNSPWVGAFFDLGNHARYGDVAEWVRELGPRIVKLDIKGYSNTRADADGKGKGFVDITDSDIDWAAVRAALREIGFTGWVSAEVGGGDVTRLRTVLDQMKRALIG